MARVKVEMQALITFEIDVDLSEVDEADEEEMIEEEILSHFEKISSTWDIEIDDASIDSWNKLS